MSVFWRVLPTSVVVVVGGIALYLTAQKTPSLPSGWALLLHTLGTMLFTIPVVRRLCGKPERWFDITTWIAGICLLVAGARTWATILG
jgi:hypothetical protein